VDGTLVAAVKALTKRAQNAVRHRTGRCQWLAGHSSESDELNYPFNCLSERRKHALTSPGRGLARS
jgi:hypothetical protein